MMTNSRSSQRRFLLLGLLVVALVACVPLAWEARQWQLERERDRTLVAAARISPHVAYQGTREIYVALEERIDVDFKDVPLEQAIKSLAKKHGIPMQCDQRTLDDAGIAE